jgi:hypothetical protein
MTHGNGYCHLHGDRIKCTYPQCSNYVQSDGVCVQHGYKKKQCRSNGCTNNAVRNGVCINHGAKCYCTMPECGKLMFQARKCRYHLRWLLTTFLIDSSGEDITVAANAIISMHHEATSTTSGHVVGGQNFHFINHHATTMDITKLTLDFIQQYVGMNNWENVIAFAGVCKSWKDATKKYTLKIGVEPMEGGGGRKLNVPGF